MLQVRKKFVNRGFFNFKNYNLTRNSVKTISNMNRKSLLIPFALMIIALAANATGDVSVTRDPNLKTFITNGKKLPDAGYQSMLRTTGGWKTFAENHPRWSVIFNEENNKPSRAFGEPIVTGFAGDPQAKAFSFITNELSVFNIPVNELQYRNTAMNQKYHYVNYKQFHNGLEVLWANIQIKMTLDGKIMLFGLKVYDDINISAVPSITPSAASAAASNLIGVTPFSVTVNPDLKILPVPVSHGNVYKLVYEITVEGRDANNVPYKYYTLVDANTGDVLYRQDRVYHSTDVTVNSTLYATHPYNPASVEPLKHLRMTVGAVNYITDTLGFFSLTANPPLTATFYLAGSWASVNTNGVVPSFTQSLGSSPITVTFDNDANIKELSAYHSVQEIHDYYQNLASFFPGIQNTMDFQMTTNIDIAGTCNAFYNGDINFYDAGGGCNPTSEIADVIYHEYGHGINEDVYQAYGGFFGNGALGEGYADTWANGRTEDPILGIGFFDNDPNGYVRRYDIDKKVYPQDLTGEVHGDGEIIAGCWWDTYLNLGSMQDRQFLFLMGYSAVLDEPGGNEGVLYQNVLIEALTDDDNDGNIFNGTPHYCEITSAFAIHGITIAGGAANVTHNEVLAAAAQTPIAVDVVAASLPNAAVPYGYYKINGAGSWTQFQLNNVGGNNYSGNIPAQPVGTIVHYYLDLYDSCGTHTSVMPGNADLTTNPNIPYYILVGFNLLSDENFDNAAATWSTAAPGDGASTGVWDITSPVISYLDPQFQTGQVQTDEDHSTNATNICAVTGNAGINDGAGTQDIDDGHTTLTSPILDLTSYTNPAFEYWRWYSNDQGATPGTDFWLTYISDDAGTTWVPIENIDVADHSWRRFVFKVLDYVTLTNQVQIKFVAGDENAGSLVEAAIDDFKIYDQLPVSINENQNILSFNVYPNPASGQISIRWNQAEQENVSLQITDHLGQVVFTAAPEMMSPGIHSINIPSEQFANGIYFVKMQGENSNVVKKITVMN